MSAVDARELMAEHRDRIVAIVDEAPPLTDGALALLGATSFPIGAASKVEAA